MPKNAPKIKIKNTKKYGADIVFYDPENESREMIGETLAQKENRILIKPYDDLDIIAGQGTAGLEMVSQLEESNIIPDVYVCCCGGGGLIAGTSSYLKNTYPDIMCYSSEPEGFDDTRRSLEKGKIISNKIGNQSICDALLAHQPGNLTFTINQLSLCKGLVVSEKEVKKTILSLAENLKIVIEPGGAVAAAAVFHNKINVKNKNVIVMLSGGNIDSDMFSNLNK
jgi:Threonine dehydratase